MKAEDQFHVGLVVDDVEAALARLASLGYEWCAELAYPTPVQLPAGDAVVDVRCVYSRTVPRVEVVQSIPGTPPWSATDSGIHHLGYWSDDVAADTAALEAEGYTVEVTGKGWAYLVGAGGPRVELVSRALQPPLEGYWAS
jgi:catechol 2,3-dioxygenase-like lactoylglutathione lyase family enzyme